MHVFTPSEEKRLKAAAYKWAGITNDPAADWEDFFLEAKARIWEKAPTFNPAVANWNTFFWMQARSAFINLHRDMRGRSQEKTPVGSIDAIPGAVDLIAGKDAYSLSDFLLDFELATKDMPPRKRGILVKLAEGFSQAEVAISEGISASRVHQLSRSLA